MEFRDLKKQYRVLKAEIDGQIQSVCASAHYISGPEVRELERLLAEYVGVKHCITCANGTDAITLALKVWEIGKGDAVFVPDFTFFSSGECPAAESAACVFVDVDERTYNIDPVRLEEAVLQIKKAGKYVPKAVVAVDLFGQPADYDAIRPVCERYGLLLLEDGAQGFGGSIGKQRACSFGDISTTSFFPAKPLGCYGDGGAVFTDDDTWAALIRSYAVHGKNVDDKYDNIRLGLNSRLDTLQAAILLAKLKAFRKHELDDINKAASWYAENLEGTGLVLPVVKQGFTSSWAQYTVQLPEGVNRSAVQEKLKADNIPSQVYYRRPMHIQRAFSATDSAKTDCKITERICNHVLSLPIHPYIAKEDVRFVSERLENALK